MQIYQDNIAARLAGNTLQPLSGVSITVTDDATNLPASLYSDDGVTPLAQPLTTDADGFFSFAAADGKYTLTFSGTRITTFTRNVVLEDPTDDPYATKTELAAVSGAELIGYRRGFDSQVMTVAQALDEATVENAAMVRGTLLTGLDLAVSAAITATDTVLSAFGKLQKQITERVGLTDFKINFRNVADTFTSFLTNANTAARTYTFPDKDGTVAMTSDFPSVGLTLLATLVPTAAAAVNALNVFTSDYDDYLIFCDGVCPSTGTPGLSMRMAVAGALDSTANYISVQPFVAAAAYSGSSCNISSNTDSVGRGLNAQISIINANNAAQIKTVFSDSMQESTAGQAQSANYTTAYKGGVVTGVGFYWSGSVNFKPQGSIRIYGIRKA